MHPELLGNPLLIKRLYDGMLRPAARSHGLTRAEMDILLFLANNPQYDTARDITRVRLLPKSQVSVSVDALCARGWLCAAHAENNRKSLHLRLLPGADAAVADGHRAQAEFWAVLTDGIPREDLARTERVAQQMARNIDRYFGGETGICY